MLQGGAVHGVEGFFGDGSVAVGAEGDGVGVAGQELAVKAFAVHAADSACVARVPVVVEFPEIVPEIEFEAGDLGIDAAVDFGDFARLVDGETGAGGLVGAVDAHEEHDALAAKRIVLLDVLVLELNDLRVEVGFVAVDGELFGGQGVAGPVVFDEQQGGRHFSGDVFLIGDEDARDAAIGFEAGADLLELLIFLLELLDLPLRGVMDIIEEETGRSGDHERGEEERFGECAEHGRSFILSVVKRVGMNH
jgi:hypothetical protein